MGAKNKLIKDLPEIINWYKKNLKLYDKVKYKSKFIQKPGKLIKDNRGSLQKYYMKLCILHGNFSKKGT